MYQRRISFCEAIKMGFESYSFFGGRSSRSEFWWWNLFGFIVGIVFGIISALVNSDVPTWIAAVALLLPNIAICVRRLHDIGKSGWWYLLNFILIIGSIILIVWYCKPSQEFENEYGEEPNMVE